MITPVYFQDKYNNNNNSLGGEEKSLLQSEPIDDNVQLHDVGSRLFIQASIKISAQEEATKLAAEEKAAYEVSERSADVVEEDKKNYEPH